MYDLSVVKEFFVLIASKSVFSGCPRSAETTISRTPCFLLSKQKSGEIAL
jgi:hypothetical protein